MALKAITVDSTVQIRRRANRKETIERYAAAFDHLPEPVVYDTSEGNLLSDGFARIEVAKRLGKTHVEVDLRKGTRADAREYAAVANATSGDPLTVDERDDAILRLSRESGWSTRQIADAMSVHHTTVAEILRAHEMRQQFRRAETTEVSSGLHDQVPEQKPSELSRTHLRTIARADEEMRLPLAQAAAARAWTREETSQAVKNLRDERVPQREKVALLAGKADPRVPTENGSAAHVDTMRRAVKVAEAANAGHSALERALSALAEAEQHGVDACLGTVNGDRARQIAALIPGHISFLNEVRKVAGGQP